MSNTKQFSAWCSQHQMHPSDCFEFHHRELPRLYPVQITKEIQFDAGHRVPNHDSKCRNPHGHRYRVVACAVGRIVQERGAPDEGMLVDFNRLKSFMVERIHDVLDHGFIVYTGDKELWQCFADRPWNIIAFPYIPTAENLARWAYDEVAPLVDGHFRGNMTLERIEVWETPTSMASYPWKVAIR